MNKTSIKAIYRGKKIYQSMKWLDNRPACYARERNSLKGKDGTALLDAVLGKGQYTFSHDDSYMPAQSGMGCVLDAPARESHKTVITTNNLAGLYDLLDVWGCHFRKNITSDGAIQKRSGPTATVKLNTEPTSHGEYHMSVC